MPEEQYNIVFAKNLIFFLNKKGLNQQDLIKLLKEKGINVGSSTVSYWCSGKKTPRSDNFDAICDVLGVTRSDLLADSKSEASDTLILSIQEEKIIKRYRASDNITREMVLRILEIEEKEEIKNINFA